MDIAESVIEAADRYKAIKNLIFIKGDITKPLFKHEVFDLVICDQVLHHTKNPPETLKELTRILKMGGEFLLMFMLKKHYQENLLMNILEKKLQICHTKN